MKARAILAYKGLGRHAVLGPGASRQGGVRQLLGQVETREIGVFHRLGPIGRLGIGGDQGLARMFGVGVQMAGEGGGRIGAPAAAEDGLGGPEQLA